MSEQSDYERLAAWIRSWTKLNEASSPWAFVERLHLTSRPEMRVPGIARLVGRSIHWDASADLTQMRCAVAREMARWCLRVVAEDDSDESATQLAAAISSSFAVETKSGRHLRLLPLAKTAASKGDRPQPASQRRPQRRAYRRQ